MIDLINLVCKLVKQLVLIVHVMPWPSPQEQAYATTTLDVSGPDILDSMLFTKM
jgi:hypothetical protein